MDQQASLEIIYYELRLTIYMKKTPTTILSCTRPQIVILTPPIYPMKSHTRVLSPFHDLKDMTTTQVKEVKGKKGLQAIEVASPQLQIQRGTICHEEPPTKKIKLFGNFDEKSEE
jgi:hypothetical protein